MAQYYQKINTIFKRDQNPGKFHNCIMPEEGFTQPEFEFLRGCKFECTEKIDGTNMSVHIIPVGYTDIGGAFKVNYAVEYHGKTEKADTPKHLQAKMEQLFPAEKMLGAFNKNVTYENVEDAIKEVNHGKVIVFGEGYGVKIQKGGNYISNDCGFILFDVTVDGMFLLRESLEDIASKLEIPIVPLIGYMTIDEAIEFVKKGFKSTIAENKDYDAEGLVLKTPMGLLNRKGERIITKIKTCDFRQLEAREKAGNR
jgi:hypothetical protein